MLLNAVTGKTVMNMERKPRRQHGLARFGLARLVPLTEGRIVNLGRFISIGFHVINTERDVINVERDVMNMEQNRSQTQVSLGVANAILRIY